ncbi:MAG: hypothetical protein RLZZ528_389 [Pseudomonadota bacterium]
MTLREDVVAQARLWLGTPYRHQASRLGAGTDCLGLVRGVWRGLGGAEPEEVPAYTPDWAEASGEEVLWSAALRHLRQAARDEPGIGQVLLFRLRDGSVAKHLGISACRDGLPSVIHAYSGHGVVESLLTQPWSRRIVARFDFPFVGA